MRLLLLKAWRDLWTNLSAFLACILMMAFAIAMLIGFSTAYLNLGESAELTYERLAFQDASANLFQTPRSLVERVAAIPGIAAVEGRQVRNVRVVLRSNDEVNGYALETPVDRDPSVNRLAVLSGSRLHSNRGEVLLEKRFADYHHYTIGDYLKVEVDTHQRRYLIVGLVSSPEYLWLTPDRLDPRPAARRFGVMWLSRPDMESLTEKGIREVVVRFKPGAPVPEVMAELERVTAAYRMGPVRPRSEQASHSLLERDRRAFAGVAAVFPAALLALSALMLFLTLWQLIHQQRKQIGILLCQGLSRGWIVLQYLALSIFVGLASIAIGSLMGPLLAHWATLFYVDTLGLPFVREVFQPRGWILGWSASLIVAVIAALAALYHLIRSRPLELLRSEFVASSANFLTWALSRLPTVMSYRIVFPMRNLLRQPWRSATMVVGVALANGLLLMTLAFNDSQRGTLDFYLVNMHRYDLQANLAEPTVSALHPPVHQWPGVVRVEEVLRAPATLLNGKNRLERGIWGLREDSRLLRPFGEDEKPLKIRRGMGVLLSPVQRRQLKISAGARLQVQFPQWRVDPLKWPLPLGPTLYEPIQGPPKMELTELQDLYSRANFTPRRVSNILLIQTAPGATDDVRHRLFQDRRIVEVTTMSQIRGDINDLMKLALAYVSLMLICAGLISLALVHACTTMNLSERRSEVACMLVQGVRQHYLFQLLLSEALYLWLIGLALGVPLGFAAGEWLLSHYQSDLIDMRLELRPGTVIGTGLASLLVTLLASWRAIWSLLQTPLAEATRSPD